MSRRLMLSGLNFFSEMTHKALNDADFADRLLKDMSINVTEMFRDPEFYLAVRENIIPLVREHSFFKIWHAGCATGEEVYSLAILLKEEGLYDKARLYATDFNDEVLVKAREAVFPLSRMREYIQNYYLAGGKKDFADYYIARYDGAIIDQALKKNIIFANHNLVSEGPFSEVNMIVCRNVLIYFNKELQKRVINLFLESLHQGGILCLGPKESLQFSKYEFHFERLSGKHPIYRKKQHADINGISRTHMKGGHEV